MAVSAADARDMNTEATAAVLTSLIFISEMSWSTRPGRASKTSSPILVSPISVNGSNGAPGAASAPLATRYASRPGFENVITASSSVSLFLHLSRFRPFVCTYTIKLCHSTFAPTMASRE